MIFPAANLSTFFFSGKHHSECVAPNVSVSISLQSGRFWATTIASFRERLLDFRSCWIVFIHVVWGRPGGLLQSSKGELLRSHPVQKKSNLLNQSFCSLIITKNSTKATQQYQETADCGFNSTVIVDLHQYEYKTILLKKSVTTNLRFICINIFVRF